MNAKSKGNTIISTVSAMSKNCRTALAAAISAAVIALVILIALTISSNSAGTSLPQSRDIFTLYDTYNMTVVVVFDEEPPIVQFIAPDGSLTNMENIRYRPGSNFVQFFLPSAMPGVWQMAYDPLTNAEITTPYAVYMEHIFIRDFTMQLSEIANGIIPVSFEVSADEAGGFNYKIHAIITAEDNNITDELLLVQGYGMLNESLNLMVDAGELSDTDGFMLRLTTYVQHGQAAIQDTAWLDLRLWWE